MASSSSPEPDWCSPPRSLEPEHVLVEHDIHWHVESIGVKWRDLGRALGYEQHTLDAWQTDKQHSTKECCIEVLVSWIRREGQNATAGALAKALKNIGLKSVAEKLIGSSEVGQTLVLYLEEQYSTKETRCRLAQNRKEGSNYLLITCTKEEYLRISEAFKSNGAIEDPLQFWPVTAQPRQEVPEDGEAKGVKEERVSVQIRNLNKKLQGMTELLEINEIREDKLKIAVRLDLCNKLTSGLHHQYTKVILLRNEASHCSEETRENYNESMLRLRSIYNDVTSQVRSLETSMADMTEEEKQQLAKLQQYLKNSSKQVDLMEKKSIPGLPKSSSSSPPDVGRNATKTESLTRANTYPGSGTPSDSSADETAPLLRGDEEIRPITNESFFQRLMNKKKSKADKCQLTSFRHGSGQDDS